jgi:hypothetical protein
MQGHLKAQCWTLSIMSQQITVGLLTYLREVALEIILSEMTAWFINSSICGG